MSDQEWKPLDTTRVIDKQRKQHEQTTSANVGGFAVPLGEPLRPPVAKPKVAKKKKKDSGS